MDGLDELSVKMKTFAPDTPSNDQKIASTSNKNTPSTTPTLSTTTSTTNNNINNNNSAPTTKPTAPAKPANIYNTMSSAADPYLISLVSTTRTSAFIPSAIVAGIINYLFAHIFPFCFCLFPLIQSIQRNLILEEANQGEDGPSAPGFSQSDPNPQTHHHAEGNRYIPFFRF